jgi:hypothetical protein
MIQTELATCNLVEVNQSGEFVDTYHRMQRKCRRPDVTYPAPPVVVANLSSGHDLPESMLSARGREEPFSAWSA